LIREIGTAIERQNKESGNRDGKRYSRMEEFVDRAGAGRSLVIGFL